MAISTSQPGVFGTAQGPQRGTGRAAPGRRLRCRPHRHRAVLRTRRGQRTHPEALYPYPDNLALVSKVGGKRDDKGAWLPDAEPHRLRAGIEDNMRSLGVDELAAVNL